MRKTTLLIIDDEKVLLENVAELLAGIADNIVTCDNPFKAIEVLKEGHVHCVICDIFMPGMNGVEVIKKTRELKNEVPFIFYTGHGNKDLMLEVAKYGALDFIDKPNMDGLEHAVVQGLKLGLEQGKQPPDVESDLKDYRKLLAKLGD
ncbi:MAG: hypothetical protein A2X86_14550 [Bdellovibrionales bacterium GWA2_49_15]|nr:MAG: hypothetical protein A2X86_14550 [Bdellovibrionales bacterium GWA2_49_15]HAZ13440.1 transcriptional regulator [Bdellovibrionales bacterium]